jgi:hypothetical protein
MIQATYKGVEIELESHQLQHGMWTCDYALTTHPQRTRTSHPGTAEFPTKDLADENALQQARDAIDINMKGQSEGGFPNPPKQVRI